jgi:hypothetical protein
MLAGLEVAADEEGVRPQFVRHVEDRLAPPLRAGAGGPEFSLLEARQLPRHGEALRDHRLALMPPQAHLARALASGAVEHQDDGPLLLAGREPIGEERVVGALATDGDDIRDGSIAEPATVEAGSVAPRKGGRRKL